MIRKVDEPAEPLRRLAHAVGVAALDVGARGGVKQDLLALAEEVDYYAFEPDEEECARLNGAGEQKPWKSVAFIPTAVSGTDGWLDLNLYRQRGCSSALKAEQDLGALFSRGDYYVHDGTVSVPSRRLDTVVTEYSIKHPAFMKIDVQGMEVECFGGAHRILSEDLVGVRTEVSFFPIYRGQPLFAEVDQALRRYGFCPMQWLELHDWRRSTRAKFPRLANGNVPYSRGQMMHGDVLYLLHPECLLDETDAEVRRLVRLGLVACCYDHFDHAYAALARSRVREFCHAVASIDPIQAIETLSEYKVRRLRGVRGILHRAVKRMS